MKYLSSSDLMRLSGLGLVSLNAACAGNLHEHGVTLAAVGANNGDAAGIVDASFNEVEAPVSALQPRVERHLLPMQCVPFARAASGVMIFGDAVTWWQQAAGRYVRSKKPKTDSVMVMRGYSGAARGHVALVRRVIDKKTIVIDHANWLNAGEISRDVSVKDVSAKGDWSEVRVWNVEGDHWGGRIYSVQGFILSPGTPDIDLKATIAPAMADVTVKMNVG